MERIDRPAWWAYLLGATAFVLVMGQGLSTGDLTGALLERSCWAMLVSGTCGLLIGNLLRRAIFDPRHVVRAPSPTASAAPASPGPAGSTPLTHASSTLAKESA